MNADASASSNVWGGAAAAEDWAVLQEPQHRPLWMAMQLAAHVQKGTRLLDAGCGSGGACFLAAHHYGAEAYGFDGSPEMVELARRRLPSGHFAVADLALPPFGEESFDVIHSSNALQLADDPVVALHAWRRCLAQPGNMVVGIWCPEEESEQGYIRRALRALAPETMGANPFALSPRGMLEGLVEQGGFRVKEARDVPVTFEYKDIDTCWRALRSGGLVQSAIRLSGEPAVRSAFAAAAQRFLMTDGSVFIHNKMRYVLGQNF